MLRRLLLPVLLPLALLPATLPANAQCIDYQEYMRFLSHEEGSYGRATRVAVDQNLAFVVGGWGRGWLLIYDISDPSDPRPEGGVLAPDITDWKGVAAANGYAYVAAGLGGLIVVEVPTRSIIGALDTPGNATDIAVVDHLVLVADGNGGLLVIDVTIPAAPVLLSQVTMIGNAISVVGAGELVYVASASGTLCILDITQPQSPELLSTLPGVAASDLVSSGSCLFAAGSSGFVVIDIADPRVPRILSSLPLSYANTVAVYGTMALVANGSLSAIDVVDPSNPVIIGTADCWASDIALDAANGCAFMAGVDYSRFGESQSGFHVFSIGNGSNPQIIGSVDTPGSAPDIAFRNPYAFIADGDYGLQVVGLSDPSLPVIIGHLNTFAAAVAVSGDHVVLGGAALHVVNVADPRWPAIVSTVEGAASAVATVDSLAFTANGSTLKIVNLANPASPVITGVVSVPGAVDVAVEDGYAYVNTQLFQATPMLRVIDVSDISNPHVVWATIDRRSTAGLAISDGLACLLVTRCSSDPYCFGLPSVVFYDVRDPLAPVGVGEYVLPLDPVDAVFADGLLYVADVAGAVNVFEVTDLDRIGYLGSSGPSGGLGTAITKGLETLLTTAGDLGLRVLPIQCATTTSLPNHPVAAAGQAAAFRMWPNPTFGVVQIAVDLPPESRASLEIYDVMGRAMLGPFDWRVGGGRVLSLDLRGRDGRSRPPSGVYTLRLSWEHGTVTRRVVLMK